MDSGCDNLGLKAADRRYTEQGRRHVPVLRSFDGFVPPLTRFNDVRQPNDCSCTPPAGPTAEMPLCVATRRAVVALDEWGWKYPFLPRRNTHMRLHVLCGVGATFAVTFKRRTIRSHVRCSLYPASIGHRCHFNVARLYYHCGH